MLLYRIGVLIFALKKISSATTSEVERQLRSMFTVTNHSPTTPIHISHSFIHLRKAVRAFEICVGGYTAWEIG